MKSWCIAPLCGVAMVTGPALLEAQPSTVILVRHAEKADVLGDGPPLSALGTARAADLALALRAATPSTIVVSTRQRTSLTAAAVRRYPVFRRLWYRSRGAARRTLRPWQVP